MSAPNPHLPNYYDPDTYSTIRPGTDPEAFDRPHNEPRRGDDDSNLMLPRWAIFLLVFVPLMLFCMGCTIYYLTRNRRIGMQRVTSLELQNLDTQARRNPTPAPSLPELYWPGVFPPDPFCATDSPQHAAGPLPAPKHHAREPQRPRKLFSSFDKSLPDLPRQSSDDGADDWETVHGGGGGASRTHLDPLGQAFAQHGRQQARDAEARTNRCLFEECAQRRQQEQRPRRTGRNPRVNDGYHQYRLHHLDLSGSDTDIVLASDTNTMTNTWTTTDRPYRAHRQRGGDMGRRRRDVGGDDDVGFAPQRGAVVAGHVIDAVAPSTVAFPGQESEVSAWTETVLSDDPFAADVARNRRMRR
ncbi:hypothetical protein B0J12DRAFT_406919 [Macrophomina phaseolina]|uniref:Transmembrane protein n=1 Tax=Macrophomina phaseolina TaxID=35725 RepID=A0ABQ8GJQ4_9PEZI|nr:hypothetical protein B0J12DRAFT_406919 [Macrophomina phaseolina]